MSDLISTSPHARPSKRKPGPKRLGYIPAQYAAITGIETLTTVRQLTRLADFLSVGAETRPPFVRLGSSVSARRGRRKPVASSTYAVDVDGVVSVVHRRDDPRRVHAWMCNERRPWHLCRDARVVSAEPPPSSVLIVTFGAVTASADAAPDWSGDVVPTILVPDGKHLRRVWPCATRRDGNMVFREFVVEGAYKWSEAIDHADLLTTREATHEVISTESVVLWIGEQGVMEYRHYSWADGELLPTRGRQLPDADSYLRERLFDRLRLRVAARCSQDGVAVEDDRVRAAVMQSVANADMQTMSLSDVGSMEASLVASLRPHEEVVA